MKAVVCYYSRHKGNTLKVLEAMAKDQELELFDISSRMAFYPERYDVIGFASGIYAGSFHESVAGFARQYLPEGSKVFLVYTSASGKGGPGKAMNTVLREKGAKILGSYNCQGMTTFGPFKLVSGFPKGHPDALELDKAREFYKTLVNEYEKN